MTLLLNKTMISEMITMRDVLPVVKKAFVELHWGTVKMPQREHIILPEKSGDCFFMPSYLQGAGAFGIKISPFFAGNLEKYDLPSVIDFILLMDENSGYPLAMMDANKITALRTGAVCGIAADYLARNDASTIAMVGMGTQARTQLEAICAVREIQKVVATSKNPETHEDFADEMSDKLEVPVEIESSVEKTVNKADIVLLATSSTKPVVRGDWIAPGAHVSSILSVGPDAREVDTSLVKQSTIVCDSVDACLKEAGELVIPIEEESLYPEDIYGSLGELVTGNKPGRRDKKEITFFKTVGLAIQDIATAKFVFEEATNKGVGETFELLR